MQRSVYGLLILMVVGVAACTSEVPEEDVPVVAAPEASPVETQRVDVALDQGGGACGGCYWEGKYNFCCFGTKDNCACIIMN